MAVIHDLPERGTSQFYDAMRAGHAMRKGHRLVAYLVERDGICEIVRECCGD